MKCLDCEAPLRVKTIGLIQVDHCARCDGTWFDEGEFGRVRTTIDPQAVELTFTSTGLPAGRCPRCSDEILAAGIVAPTAVGRCPGCRGIWVSKPIRTAEERKAAADGWTEVLQIVFAVIQFFAEIVG
jgi:Zn-finger nucleic acid-binding protein